MRAATPVEMPQQPGAQPRGGPDVLHGDAGGAALEPELEEGLGAAAVDDFDPGVGGGGDELDDFDDAVSLATVALEVDAVAVALTLLAQPRHGSGAVGEPVGHAARIGEELEHLFDRDADEAGVGERDGAHGCNLQPGRQRAAEGGKGGKVVRPPDKSLAARCRPLPPFASLPPLPPVAALDSGV